MAESLWNVFERIARSAETGRAGVEVGPHGIRIYPIDRCERCGCEVEGVGGTGWIQVEGWTLRDYVEAAGPYVVELPEVGACDALGGIAVCPECYRDEA